MGGGLAGVVEPYDHTHDLIGATQGIGATQKGGDTQESERKADEGAAAVG